MVYCKGSVLSQVPAAASAHPQIVKLGASNFLTVWSTDDTVLSAAKLDLKGNIINSFNISYSASSSSNDFYLNSNSDGNAVVSWSTVGGFNAPFQIQIIDQTGIVLGKNYTITFPNYTPFATSLPSGGFFISLHNESNAGTSLSTFRMGQYFDNNAAPISSAFTIRDSYTNNTIQLLSVVGLNDGVALLYQNGTSSPVGLFLDKISLNGTVIASDVIIENALPEYYITTVSMHPTTDGNKFNVFYYTSFGASTSNTDLFRQQFTSSLTQTIAKQDLTNGDKPGNSAGQIDFLASTIIDSSDSFAITYFNGADYNATIKTFSSSGINTHYSVATGNEFIVYGSSLAYNNNTLMAIWSNGLGSFAGELRVEPFDTSLVCPVAHQLPSSSTTTSASISSGSTSGTSTTGGSTSISTPTPDLSTTSVSSTTSGVSSSGTPSSGTPSLFDGTMMNIIVGGVLSYLVNEVYDYFG